VGVMGICLGCAARPSAGYEPGICFGPTGIGGNLDPILALVLAFPFDPAKTPIDARILYVSMLEDHDIRVQIYGLVGLKMIKDEDYSDLVRYFLRENGSSRKVRVYPGGDIIFSHRPVYWTMEEVVTFINEQDFDRHGMVSPDSFGE